MFVYAFISGRNRIHLQAYINDAQVRQVSEQDSNALIDLFIYLFTWNWYVHTLKGDVRGVMVTVVGNGPGDRSSKPWTRLVAFNIVQIPFEKGMNPVILPPARGKLWGRLGS